MSLRRVVNGFLLSSALAWLALSGSAMASEYHGQVTFGGLPVPGSTVTVTATQGDKKAVAISDDQGIFSFADLTDGKWTLEIVMTGFAPMKQEVTVAPSAAAATFELKLMSIDEIRAAAKPVKIDPTQAVVATVAASTVAPPANAAGKAATVPAKGAVAAKGAGDAKSAAPASEVAAVSPAQDPMAAQANDGLLINGSVNNAATSQFSMNQAFGNNRNGGRSLYNGNVFLRLDNSSLDAAPFSVTGVPVTKPQFNNYTVSISAGGPLNIPRLMPRGPYLGISYSHAQSDIFNTQPALIPTGQDASGNWNLSQQQNVTSIYVPTSGLSAACLGSPGVVAGGTFPNNVIPAACVTHASTVLLALYPQQPNLVGNSQYNYQLPLTDSSQSDSVQFQVQKQIGNKNNISGGFSFSDSRSSNPSIFGFLDTSATLNVSGQLSYNHRFTQRLNGRATYQFSRSRNQFVPNFANKNDIEGAAGIAGGSTDPRYWGPPSLSFSSSITGLRDGVSQYNRPETNSIGVQFNWNHMRHDFAFGGDFRRQENNYLTQSNPNGSLGFTGAATRSSAGVGGSDFADFLLGIPDTSRIAYGNPDKYLRESVYDLYIRDDFRVNPEFSMNVGLRWEYGAPVTELKGRLVNLDVAPDFSAETTVLGSNPKGALTGQSYPTSLVHPDYSRPEPNVSFAWRPISGSSLLVRSSYQIANDTSVYLSAAYAMAQQFPLSKSLSIANSPACGFTIANPFSAPLCSTTSPDTFALDPNFKVGYVQLWTLSVQRDLPFSLQTLVTYAGTKGTHGVQEFLPNTCPPPASGVSTPCTTAVSGYEYRTSGGNLTRESGSLELRRRMRNGFQSRLLYTYSKMLDDDYSLSGQGSVSNGSGLAQDWLHLNAQRGLSTTDQRHLLTLTAQYTTGMGLGGKTLMSGWKGAIYKEWTVAAMLNAGSGLPETPIYAGATASGTGVNGTIRPNLIGSPYANLQPGYYLNANAYAAPLGQWGNARRDSIQGPSQFGLNATMNRTFRLHDRYTLDATLSANNVLNHVVISGYNTSWIPPTLTTPTTTTPAFRSQFGAALGANSMRSVILQLRMRF